VSVIFKPDGVVTVSASAVAGAAASTPAAATKTRANTEQARLSAGILFLHEREITAPL
jgi:hypothetical protein